MSLAGSLLPDPYPPRALPVGQLDREVLVDALTFVLDSIRAGTIDDSEGKLTGSVGTARGTSAFWNQSDWLDVDSPIPASMYRPDGQRVTQYECGTACCIAGWIDLRVNGADAGGRPSVVARERLVGNEETAYDEIDRLFDGRNDLVDLMREADRVLAHFGLPPLQLDPDGTFR